MAALDAVRTKYEARGKEVAILGMNTESAARHDRLSGNLGAD